MKAYIRKLEFDNISPNGRIILGTQDSFISREYKNMWNLKRFALRGLTPGVYRIEAYYDFCNDKYKEPADITEDVTIES